MDGIPFEVEFVRQEPGHRALVMARVLTEQHFALGKTPSLGGCPILPHLSQPRALKPDGSPRLDLFAFALQTRTDASRFHAGQRVFLAV